MEKRIPYFLTRITKVESRQSKHEIRAGDIVIVHNDNKLRLQWKPAIVEDLMMGKDGQVHTAHIRTSNCSTT